MNEKNLSLLGHLNELRRVLIVSGVALLVGCVVALYFSDTLDWLLRLPIQNKFPSNSQPVYLGIFEPIFYRLKAWINRWDYSGLSRGVPPDMVVYLTSPLSE